MVYLFPFLDIFMKPGQIQNYLYLTSSPVVISWLQNLLLFLRDGQEVFGKKLHHVLIGAIALVSPWLYWAGSSEGWGPTSHMPPQHTLALPANGGYCFLLNASLLYWFLPGYTSLILQLPFPKVTSQVNYLYDKPCLKVCCYPLQKKGERLHSYSRLTECRYKLTLVLSLGIWQ